VGGGVSYLNWREVIYPLGGGWCTIVTVYYYIYIVSIVINAIGRVQEEATRRILSYWGIFRQKNKLIKMEPVLTQLLSIDLHHILYKKRSSVSINNNDICYHPIVAAPPPPPPCVHCVAYRNCG